MPKATGVQEQVCDCTLGVLMRCKMVNSRMLESQSFEHFVIFFNFIDCLGTEFNKLLASYLFLVGHCRSVEATPVMTAVKVGWKTDIRVLKSQAQEERWQLLRAMEEESVP